MLEVTKSKLSMLFFTNNRKSIPTETYILNNKQEFDELLQYGINKMDLEQTYIKMNVVVQIKLTLSKIKLNNTRFLYKNRV